VSGFAAGFACAFVGVRFFTPAVVFLTGFFAGIFIPGVILCAVSACAAESDFWVVGVCASGIVGERSTATAAVNIEAITPGVIRHFGVCICFPK
jgi:hypothetical protein